MVSEHVTAHFRLSDLASAGQKCSAFGTPGGCSPPISEPSQPFGYASRSVLGQTARQDGGAAGMRAISRALHKQSGRNAGNGSLMRTGPVALAHLGDSPAIVEATRLTGRLTHHDPVAQDACALWCLAIDHAVRTGELDVRVGWPTSTPPTGRRCSPAIPTPELARPASRRARRETHPPAGCATRAPRCSPSSTTRASGTRYRECTAASTSGCARRISTSRAGAAFPVGRARRTS